jgi:hypothetical protein
MNLLKKFLYKYWIFLILTVIIGILLGFYLLNKRVAEEEKYLLLIPKTLLESYSVDSDFNLNSLEKNFLELEKKEMVYEVKYPSFNNQEAVLIAEKFNFNNPPIVFTDQRTKEIFYEWKDDAKSLSINLTKGKVEYINFNSYDTFKQNVSISNSNKEVEKIAKDFINKNNFMTINDIKIEIDRKSKINLYEIDENLIVDQIEFKCLINNKQILNSGIDFLITENGEILKFIFNPPFKEIKELTNYPIKNKEEVFNILKKIKEINYFDILDSYGTLEDINKIQNINLGKIEMVYLKTEVPQSYLQPIFFISGQAVLNNGQNAEVGLYIPAIKDEYLLK